MIGQDASLGAALAAFIEEHEYCGELDTVLENKRMWVTCTCGARIARELEGVRGR
jgi:hypothetical protein